MVCFFAFVHSCQKFFFVVVVLKDKTMMSLLKGHTADKELLLS